MTTSNVVSDVQAQSLMQKNLDLETELYNLRRKLLTVEDEYMDFKKKMINCKDISTSPKSTFVLLTLIYEYPLECVIATMVLTFIVTLFLSFCDQRCASYYAKKFNIKQKSVMKFMFPTIICMAQIMLRKRNKNSTLANALSGLKYHARNKTCSNSTTSKSSANTPPVVHLSSVQVNVSISDNDSVFEQSSHSQKKQKRSKNQRKSRQNKKVTSSTVAVNMSSQQNPSVAVCKKSATKSI